MNSVVLNGKLGAGFNDDRYTLPKDGNPGDILVKTEAGSAWQKQEAATTTPDWNQNDATASDYIKNKPCYKESVAKNILVAYSKIFMQNASVELNNDLLSKAMDYGNDYKPIIMLTIKNQDSIPIEINRPLPFIEDDDSSYARIYGDRVFRLTKAITNDNANLYVPAQYVDCTYYMYIAGEESVYYTIDDLYIPDTIQRVGSDVIINSSTSGSEKKFKITVDDSGTLSATEVT
nr:MAG TPA: hypothetical protein [Caudoviricetes sp.]